MAILTDVKKLRPELLDLSVAELERRRAEIDMAIGQKAAEEEAKRRQALVEEATGKVETVVAGLKWLHENGFLSAKVADTFTSAAGVFNAATYIRAPRSVDDVLTGKRAEPVGDKPKRLRRVRDAEGNLVPSKKMQAAG